MAKLYHFVCPKCNNSRNFYRYGKDSDGYQKYQCRACNHQFAPTALGRERGKLGDRVSGHIPRVRVAEKLALFTTTTITTQTTVAPTSTATIHFVW